VVIAIIGILSGMVVVNMSGATDKARIAKGITFAASIQRSMGLNCMGDWGFDEGSGTSAIDSSGNGSTGIIYGSPSYSTSTPYGGGIAGQYALNFDGVNDYARVSDSPLLSPAGGLTISSWVYTSQANFGSWTIVGKDQSFQNQLVADNKIQNSIYCGGAWHQVDTTSAPLVPGRWNYVAVTFDGSVQKTYANGEIVQQWNLSCQINDSSSDLYIGSWTGTSEFFNGTIDQVRIYNAALPASAIRENYLAGLDQLLANGQITNQDYQQRLADLNSNYAISK
jgi:type II secretory pathway pseudopilin PulG